MKVNTVCIELGQYDALIKDNQRMHQKIMELECKVKAVDAVIQKQMQDCIDRDRKLAWSSIETQEVLKAMTYDMDSLDEYVDMMRKSKEESESVDEGYQE